MTETSASDNDFITLAENAAEQLFNAKNGESPPTYEPSDVQTACAATRRLGELFDELPGTVMSALKAARETGDLLSSDRLQGLAEIVQNADDVVASQVRLLLSPTELLASHNGSPVRLPHVLALAMPWLSTKADEAATTGRFGIGITTLRSLSKTLEVHCDPYHVRLGDPTVVPIDPPALPTGFSENGWTVLRVPLRKGVVSQTDLKAWLDRWDDSALLFLRNVTRITLFNSQGGAARELAVTRHADGAMPLDAPSSTRTVLRQRVEVRDGRSWLVYSANLPTPRGVSRTRKETERMTPVAVALPQYQVDHGRVYAGLPVIHTRLPLFVSVQLDRSQAGATSPTMRGIRR